MCNGKQNVIDFDIKSDLIIEAPSVAQGAKARFEIPLAVVTFAHGLCDEHGDIATASLLEIWIDEAERRTWFLFETTRRVEL